MKIEQKMEQLHAELNSLEDNRKNQRNRALRFLNMIKAQEVKMKSNRENFVKKLKDYPNGKQNKN